MTPAAAYAAPFLVLAGCVAYAAAGGRLPALILRARWAWRCRGKPALPGHETIREPEKT